MIIKHLVIAGLTALAAHTPDAERAQIVRNVSPLLTVIPSKKSR